MANAKNESTFWAELAAVRLYKRNQGRLARQVTAIAIFVVIALGGFTLYEGETLTKNPQANGIILFAVCGLGAWAAFRVVNYPRFADFLISVEAEMDKVTWASRSQLYQATVVVITTMMFLSALLFVYDWFWMILFRFVHFLEID